MPTINQLLRKKKRISKKTNLKKTPALQCNPQKHGTCISVFTKTPRKPNSALRKVAKVRLVNSRIITVYIPGEGHNISRFSDVLISGRRIRDLPGVKYGALRGKFDLSSVDMKKNGRSKYGQKKPKVDQSLINKKKRNRQFRNRFYYKIFKRMFSLSVFNQLSKVDQRKYWMKCYFYFNLLCLNNTSKRLDSKGYFQHRFKALLLFLYNYKVFHSKKHSKSFPYNILFANRQILIVRHTETKKIYSYMLKKF